MAVMANPHSAAVHLRTCPGINLSNRLNMYAKKNAKFFTRAVKKNG